MSSQNETMRAVVAVRPGGPDVLEIAMRPRPKPGEGQILIRSRLPAQTDPMYCNGWANILPRLARAMYWGSRRPARSRRLARM